MTPELGLAYVFGIMVFILIIWFNIPKTEWKLIKDKDDY